MVYPEKCWHKVFDKMRKLCVNGQQELCSGSVERRQPASEDLLQTCCQNILSGLEGFIAVKGSGFVDSNSLTKIFLKRAVNNNWLEGGVHAVLCSSSHCLQLWFEASFKVKIRWMADSGKIAGFDLEYLSQVGKNHYSSWLEMHRISSQPVLSWGREGLGSGHITSHSHGSHTFAKSTSWVEHKWQKKGLKGELKTWTGTKAE